DVVLEIEERRERAVEHVRRGFAVAAAAREQQQPDGQRDHRSPLPLGEGQGEGTRIRIALTLTLSRRERECLCGYRHDFHSGSTSGPESAPGSLITVKSLFAPSRSPNRHFKAARFA